MRGKLPYNEEGRESLPLITPHILEKLKTLENVTLEK